MNRPQNRIDYIVYNNPKAVRQLIYNEGYEPPKRIAELAKATKQLVKKNGRAFVEKLVQQHPDRKAILQIGESEKDACCLACGHQSFEEMPDKWAFLDRLMAMGMVDLEKYYKNLSNKVKDHPDDKHLEEEVQMVWNELRQRKKQEKHAAVDEGEEKNGLFNIANNILIAMGLTLLAGILIGTSIHSKSNG